jgi:hypothetical protein
LSTISRVLGVILPISCSTSSWWPFSASRRTGTGTPPM